LELDLELGLLVLELALLDLELALLALLALLDLLELDLLADPRARPLDRLLELELLLFVCGILAFLSRRTSSQTGLPRPRGPQVPISLAPNHSPRAATDL
jgi:hypothetical protein